MILEVTRGHIKLKYKDRIITILGEALLPGYGSPDFVVYSNSITHWDDDSNIPIDRDQKEKILDLLKKDANERNLSIEIE
jgi:hypothetical protein